MKKLIDHLFHFTEKISTIQNVFEEGFKPSYANETIGGRKIKVAMISFSNVLLRDVGEQEVLNYGKYAIGVTREWAIANNINPVLYTYDEGLLEQNITTMLENSLFLGYIENFKDKIKEMSDCKCGPFSKYIKMEGVSAESIAIVDYLSSTYDDDLIKIISVHSRRMHDTNLTNIKLIKPYKVLNKRSEENIAYNDREWRKVYAELPILFEGSDEYQKWDKEAKPHFHADPFLMHIKIEDVKAILVEKGGEIDEIIEILKRRDGRDKVKELLDKGELCIGTKETLEKIGF